MLDNQRGREMGDEKLNGPEPLRVIHVCKACGEEYSYLQVPDDVTVSGVVVCSKCGFAGPLNVAVK